MLMELVAAMALFGRQERGCVGGPRRGVEEDELSEAEAGGRGACRWGDSEACVYGGNSVGGALTCSEACGRWRKADGVRGVGCRSRWCCSWRRGAARWTLREDGCQSLMSVEVAGRVLRWVCYNRCWGDRHQGAGGVEAHEWSRAEEVGSGRCCWRSNKSDEAVEGARVLGLDEGGG